MHSLARTRRVIAALKRPADPAALPRIPVRDEAGREVAALRPVPAELSGEAAGDAPLMAEWRNRHRESFFTWVTSTEASTRAWLASAYAPDDLNLIFMLETPDRKPFGHLALSGFSADGKECEFGRVLRGNDLGPKGAVMRAAQALLAWAAAELGVEKVFLEVFSDNARAIDLYRRLGFREAGTRPVRKAVEGERIRWVPAEASRPAEARILRMEWTPGR